MARFIQGSPAVLATMNSSEGSRDTLPRTKAQELCNPREPGAPQQIPQSTLSSRNTIPDPSDTYLAPQFQESFNQVARATMDEINRTSDRTPVRFVPPQRPDRSLCNSGRTSRAIAPMGPTRGDTALRSRVVDVRKNLTVRNIFLQVAAKHPRACLNGMSCNSAIRNQAIPPGSRHLVVLSFGGASVAQVLKMMEFQGVVITLGTNDVSRAPVTPEGKWERCWSAF